MRIFLLPISTRRTLLYCEKHAQASLSSAPEPLSALLRGPVNTLPDRIVHRANATWADWERSDTGWKATLTKYGNQAFRRIPFEEWGLKSLPPLHASARAAILGSSSSDDENSKSDKEGSRAATAARATTTAARPTATVLHPPRFLASAALVPTLQRLATERQPLHRTRLMWSVVGLPLSIPFGLIPILPNIPFFYLAFRAWSHYRALYGARYLAALVDADNGALVKAQPEGVLDRVYAAALRDRVGVGQGKGLTAISGADVKEMAAVVQEASNKDNNSEVMLLNIRSAQLVAEHYGLPELELEIERAVEQVEASLVKEAESKGAKGDKES